MTLYDPLASLQPRYMHTVKTPQQKMQKKKSVKNLCRRRVLFQVMRMAHMGPYAVWPMFKPHEKLPSSVASLRGRLSCQRGLQVGKGWSPNVSNFVQFGLSCLSLHLWCCCQMDRSCRLCLFGLLPANLGLASSVPRCSKKIITWRLFVKRLSLKLNSASCGWHQYQHNKYTPNVADYTSRVTFRITCSQFEPSSATSKSFRRAAHRLQCSWTSFMMFHVYAAYASVSSIHQQHLPPYI